jgi:hypothetical protein
MSSPSRSDSTAPGARICSDRMSRIWPGSPSPTPPFTPTRAYPTRWAATT